MSISAGSGAGGGRRRRLGDFTLSALAFWNRGKFHWSWNNYVVAPVGEYDVDDLANSGLNYWTFEVDFAATYLDQEKGSRLLRGS